VINTGGREREREVGGAWKPSEDQWRRWLGGKSRVH